ncbi:hypothetical protein [Peribacillus deserti]|uniref:Lipoprotein n=1 Tax=Peribacillus deserti TaxID=673318 RepID=A0A2N5M413_9BACI|nr:hypothetical protein [Peribacillus deserti]PLT29106.1 hypothetical protein CUU66_14920 [Peribacillus deserti]
MVKRLYSAVIAAALLTGCGQTEEAAKNTEGAVQKVKEESKKAVNEVDKKTQPAQDKIKQEADTGNLKDKTNQAVDKVKQEADTGNLKDKTKQAVDKVKQTINTAKTKTEKKILEPGEQAVLEEDAFLAKTDSEYDKLYQFIKINDYDGVSSLVKQNKAIELKKGDTVEIISREAVKAKVLVKDTQDKGFLPTSLLQPRN